MRTSVTARPADGPRVRVQPCTQVTVDLRAPTGTGGVGAARGLAGDPAAAGVVGLPRGLLALMADHCRVALGPAGPLSMAPPTGFAEIVCTSRLAGVTACAGSRATAETCGFAVGMVRSPALLDGLPTVTVGGACHAIATAG